MKSNLGISSITNLKMPAPFYTLTSNSSYKHKYPALLALYPFTVRLLLLPNSSISGSDQPNNIASWFTGRSTRKKLGGLGRAKGRKEREVVITWNVNLECTNRSFSHDVTAAIFVYKTMNRRPCLCTKKNPVGIELFSHVNTFF